jgi:hypothetical protein
VVVVVPGSVVEVVVDEEVVDDGVVVVVDDPEVVDVVELDVDVEVEVELDELVVVGCAPAEPTTAAPPVISTPMRATAAAELTEAVAKSRREFIIP